MSNIENTSPNKNTSTSTNLISRLGNRVVRIVTLIFSPLTYLFRKIYNFFFGSRPTDENKDKEPVDTDKRVDIDLVDEDTTTSVDNKKAEKVLTEEEIIEQKRVLNEGATAQLKNLDTGEEAVLTQAMIDAGFGLSLTMPSVKNMVRAKVSYEREEENYNFKEKRDGTVVVTREVKKNENDKHRYQRSIPQEQVSKGYPFRLQFFNASLTPVRGIIVEQKASTTTYVITPNTHEGKGVVIKKTIVKK